MDPNTCTGEALTFFIIYPHGICVQHATFAVCCPQSVGRLHALRLRVGFHGTGSALCGASGSAPCPPASAAAADLACGMLTGSRGRFRLPLSRAPPSLLLLLLPPQSCHPAAQPCTSAPRSLTEAVGLGEVREHELLRLCRHPLGHSSTVRKRLVNFASGYKCTAPRNVRRVF